jgi:hypothetical protein
MSESYPSETVERRLGQIEHLLNELLERHARASVKDRLSIERAIEKVGLELSDHRNISEGANFYSSERITEKEIENRLFEQDRQGWEMVGLSILPAIPANESQENLFLVVFRKSEYYVPSKTIESPSDN